MQVCWWVRERGGERETHTNWSINSYHLVENILLSSIFCSDHTHNYRWREHGSDSLVDEDIALWAWAKLLFCPRIRWDERLWHTDSRCRDSTVQYGTVQHHQLLEITYSKTNADTDSCRKISSVSYRLRCICPCNSGRCQSWGSQRRRPVSGISAAQLGICGRVDTRGGPGWIWVPGSCCRTACAPPPNCCSLPSHIHRSPRTFSYKKEPAQRIKSQSRKKMFWFWFLVFKEKQPTQRCSVI